MIFPYLISHHLPTLGGGGRGRSVAQGEQPSRSVWSALLFSLAALVVSLAMLPQFNNRCQTGPQFAEKRALGASCSTSTTSLASTESACRW